LGLWGWGGGVWGWGIGDWAQSPIPNPQSPIPNPQSPIKFSSFILIYYDNLTNVKNYIKNKYK